MPILPELPLSGISTVGASGAYTPPTQFQFSYLFNINDETSYVPNMYIF